MEFLKRLFYLIKKKYFALRLVMIFYKNLSKILDFKIKTPSNYIYVFILLFLNGKKY